MKKLTPDNWLEPEAVMSLYVRMAPGDPTPRPISGEDWVAALTTPHLIDAVPEEVTDLFEAARGAIAYGYFFYPLYAIGLGQLFRVVEAAVSYKCNALDAPTKVKMFYDQIGWLISERVISEAERGVWDAIRNFRNLESHPRRQTLLTPGDVIGMLARLAQDINGLFDGPPSTVPTEASHR